MQFLCAVEQDLVVARGKAGCRAGALGYLDDLS